MLEIRTSNRSIAEKAKTAISETRRASAIVALIKAMARELKRVGWDERSWKARLGLGAAVASLAAFGNAGAGIAALGGAVGVPLWVVVGAGGTFAGVLVEELEKSLRTSEK